jgi:hypothetical protein
MFDQPRTATLRALIAKEGPTGTGRIVGLSIEGADGVFIYTESAKWCDDSGSGTFRGDSETAACRRFLERVRKAEAVAEDAAEAAQLADATGAGAVTSDAATERESAIAPKGTFATVYESAAAMARPLGTVSRPYRGDSHGLFTLTGLDGQLVAAWARMPTLRAIREALGKAYTARRAAIAESKPCTPEAVAEAEAVAREAFGVARKYEPGTIGRAAYLRSWALARIRAEAVAEKAANAAAVVAAVGPAPRCACGRVAPCFLCLPLDPDGTRNAAEAARRGQPRSLSAAATPSELRGGYDAAPAASGAFPFRAVRVAMAERAARAISDSLGLGVDLFDPFDSDPDSVSLTGAPGWLDSDREFFGPEAGGFWLCESGAASLGVVAVLAAIAAGLAFLAPVLADAADAMRAASAVLSR